MKQFWLTDKKILNLIKQELLEDKEKYGDDRKTQILPEQGELNIEDLTPNTAMAVFITRQGISKEFLLILLKDKIVLPAVRAA